MKISVPRQFLLCLVAILALQISVLSAQVEFIGHTIDGQFDGPGGVYACDVNGDGYCDVLGASSNDGEIAWWRNVGDGSWTKQSIDDQFPGAIFVFAADVDGDVDTDVLGAAWSGHQIAWWRNDGGDPVTWTKQIIDENFGGAHEVRASDLDGDGDIDVLGAAAEDHEIAWWRNDGGTPIAWTKQTIQTGYTGARSVCVADIDGDMDTDVLGAALGSNELTWWRNDGGDPITWVKRNISSNFTGSHMVRTYDLDNDGDPDVLGTAYTARDIAWWRNDGGDPVAWTRITVDGDFEAAVTAHAADLDMDGDLDVFGTGQQTTGEIAWWRNDGGDPMVWTKIQINDQLRGIWPSYFCDFDNDTDIDLVCGAFNSNSITWLDNTLFGADFDMDVTTGHAPLTVQFTSRSNADPPLTAWKWDVDGDGTVDSEEEHPRWTYTEAGTYSVSLEVSNGSDTYTRIRQECIHVFDGESALDFNGSDSYVSCPAAPLLNLTGAFTFEAWINPAGWGEFFTFGLGKIFDKKYVFLQTVNSYLTLNQQSLLLQIFHQNGTNSYSNSPQNSVTLDQWQHVAVTYNGQDQVRMYINGIEQTVTYTTPPSGPVRENGTDDLYIGNDALGGYTFDGIMDEVRVWNTVRSEGDISDYMEAYLSGDEPGLAASWRMNEGSAEALSDQTENQYDATAVNISWVQGVLLTAPSLDDDGDGVTDADDNCPEVYNPQQEDDDGDGIGDMCDNCPATANPDQIDTDSDENGDDCDDCTDTDGDGFGDPGYAMNTCIEDNCPDVSNPDQAPADRGDINCADGINVLDVLGVINNILGTVPLSGGPLDRADCNHDGNVNILDALGIINVILGIGECVPDARPVVTPEVLAFCESLEPLLPVSEYARFMSMVKTEAALPTEFGLEQNYPNPFNPETNISYQLSAISDQTTHHSPLVTLKIYNVLGQEVNTVVNEIQKPGYYTVTWNGHDNTGAEVPTGIYFYRLTAGVFTATRSMVLMK